MNDQPELKWLDAPADEEYAAAGRYLELLYEPKQARQLMKKLKRADMAQYPAKDILRASGISILTVQAYDWSKQENEIKKGDPLSPILVVRQENGAPLIIADGFHRLCAVFAQNEQIVVPCKIV